MEEWKDIKNYEGLYQVSNEGRVKSLTYRKCVNGIRTQSPANKMLKPSDNGNGYLIVGLTKEGKRQNHYVHRLVADAFIPNDKEMPEINHKDFNKKNNCVENLEWCTRIGNVKHSQCNCYKPHNVNSSPFGYKYIGWRKEKNRYRVNIKVCGISADRLFKRLEDAIKFRDGVINEIYNSN